MAQTVASLWKEREELALEVAVLEQHIKKIDESLARMIPENEVRDHVHHIYFLKTTRSYAKAWQDVENRVAKSTRNIMAQELDKNTKSTPVRQFRLNLNK